jgi:hypothetical protein
MHAFIIKTSQLQMFSDVKIEQFVKKTIAFLRKNFVEWAGEKDDAELAKYIHSMIDLGKRYKILKEINLQKLMHYHIRYKFDIPLHKDLEQFLVEHKLKERNRLENFHRRLQSEVAA